jgi:hypothetical protein
MEEEQQLLRKNDKHAIRNACICCYVLICLIVSCSILGVQVHKYRHHDQKLTAPAIIVQNNCQNKMYFNLTNLYEGYLYPNKNIQINLTSGWSGSIYASENILDTIQYPYTQIIFEYIDSNADSYAVSFANGYNIAIDIKPLSNYAEDIGVGWTCQYPQWNYPITAEECPTLLQAYINDKYIGCNNPCTVFNTAKYCCHSPYNCQTKTCTNSTCVSWSCDGLDWPDNYTSVFHDACPQCSLTNCTFSNFACRDGWSRDNWNVYATYQVTLCPV